jgi:hypothetical protein
MQLPTRTRARARLRLGSGRGPAYRHNARGGRCFTACAGTRAYVCRTALDPRRPRRTAAPPRLVRQEGRARRRLGAGDGSAKARRRRRLGEGSAQATARGSVQAGDASSDTELTSAVLMRARCRPTTVPPLGHVAPLPLGHVAPLPLGHVAPLPLGHVAPLPLGHVAPLPLGHVASCAELTRR